MPVPVINRALKLDPSTARKDTTTGDAQQGPEADRNQSEANVMGAEGEDVPVPYF